jgi:ribosomal protein L29
MSARARTRTEVVTEALRALSGLRERLTSARAHMEAGPVSVLLLEQVRRDIADAGAMLAPMFAAHAAGALDIQALLDSQVFREPGSPEVDYVTLWHSAYAAGAAVWPEMQAAAAGRVRAWVGNSLIGTAEAGAPFALWADGTEGVYAA